MKKLPEHLIHTTLAKHTDPAQDQPLYVLRDGRQVIDQLVDSENHLHYVVRNADNSTEVIDAQGAGVVQFLQAPASHTVTVSNAVPDRTRAS